MPRKFSFRDFYEMTHDEKLPRTKEAFYEYLKRKSSDERLLLYKNIYSPNVIRGVLKRDNKLVHILYNSTDKRKAELAVRRKVRYRLEKLGLVSKGDGKQIHHKDGNPFNNHWTNLVILDEEKHRCVHQLGEHNCGILTDICQQFPQKCKYYKAPRSHVM